LKKFKDKPNSEDMHFWLQRIAIVANIGIDCEGELFKLVERKHNDGNPVVLPSIANIAEFDFICEVMVTSPPQSIQDLMLLH
jgi:hypothetical protein